MPYPFKDKDRASEAGKSSSRKGVPNKTTKEIRDAFQCFVEDNLPKLQEMFDSIPRPQDKLAFLKELSEYILPKLSRAEVKAEVENKDVVDLSKLPDDVLRRILDEDREE